MFQGAPYSASVMENHVVDTTIGVTAMAADSVEGHTVRYSIDPNSRDGDHFDIGETSGEITLAASLDADPPIEHTTLTFYVRACVTLLNTLSITSISTPSHTYTRSLQKMYHKMAIGSRLQLRSLFL